MYRILKCQNCEQELAQVKSSLVPFFPNINGKKEIYEFPIWNENNAAVFFEKKELIVECRKCKGKHKVSSNSNQFEIELI